MTADHRKEIKKMWVMLSLYYQSQIRDEILDMYVDDVSDLEFNEVRRAFELYRLTSKYTRPPVPAHLREILSPTLSIKDQATDLCHTILAHLLTKKSKWNLDLGSFAEREQPKWIAVVGEAQYGCESREEALELELNLVAAEAVIKMGGVKNLYQEYVQSENKTFLRSQLRDLISAILEREQLESKTYRPVFALASGGSKQIDCVKR